MNISLIFQNLSFLTLYFLAAAALSFILTRLLIAILPQFHLIDEPGGRHQHERSVPCGGGLAIICSFVIIMGAYLFSSTISGSILDCPLVKQFLLPTVLITILGLADDRYELKSWQKLLVHILIGLYFYFVGVKIDHFLSYQLPFWIALPVTVCWVIGIINAFNLIDGMDGLAAGLAMISAFAMAFWFAITGDLNQPISLIVFCGACLGFLHFNFAPARIFMGDTGSMFIGMFFAYFSIICSAKIMTISSLLVPVLAMGIPLFDVFLAILRRVYRRYIKHDKNAGIMVGDHDHLHHRIWAKMEKNTRKATLVLYALALLLVFGAMGAALLNDMLQTLSFGLLLLVLFIVVRFATIESFNAASMIIDGIRRPHRKFLVTAIHPVIDVSLLVTAYAAAAFLFRYQLFFPVFQWEPVLCCIAPYPVILSISRIYRTYWLRTNVYRFWLLFQMLLLASLLSMSMMFFFFLSKNGLDHIKLFGMEQFVIIFSLLGSGFILFERFLLHYAESYWFQHLATSLADLKNPLPRTLLYGGGLYCRMFLVSQDNACRGGHVSRKILGIIDDNPTLSHLNIFGMDVLGNCDDLDALLAKYHFDEIVITLRDIPPKTRSHLIEFGKKNNVRIQEFRTHLEMY